MSRRQTWSDLGYDFSKLETKHSKYVSQPRKSTLLPSVGARVTFLLFKSSCACNREGEELNSGLRYTTSCLQSQEVEGKRVEEEEDLCKMDACMPKSGGRSHERI